MKSLLLFCLLLISPTSDVIPALAENPPSAIETDPSHLQQQGIARMEQYRDHFRKTGDFASLRPELEIADQELAKSAELFLQRGDQANAALSLIKRGDAIMAMNNRQEQAAEVYQQALQVARHADHKNYQAKALVGFGRAKKDLRQFDEAARFYQEAIALCESSGNKEDLANALDRLAQLQEAKGELVAASDTINRAVAVAEELKDPKLLLYFYMDRGGIYIEFSRQCDYKTAFKVCYGYLDLAKADYEKVIKIAQDLGYQGLIKFGQFLEMVEARRKLVHFRENSVKKHFEQKIFQPLEAKDVLVHERFVLSSGPKMAPETTNKEILGFVGDFYKRMKITNFSELWAFGETSGMNPSQNATWMDLKGDFLRGEGKNDEALAAYLKAVELLEQERGRLRDEEARGSYMEDKVNIYYKPILILLDQRRYPEAFDLMERSRSRAMADLLATRDLEIASDQGRDLYAQYRDLKADIAHLQKHLFRLRAQPGSSAPAETAALERQILDREKKFQNLEVQIGKKAPRLQELLVAKPVSLQELQEDMRRDGYEVIEYLIDPTFIILWHITADSVRVKSVYLPETLLEQKVQKLRASIADKEQAFDVTMARQLFLFLIEPVKADIKQEHLVIIPHGVLNRIPFQVLQDPTDSKVAAELRQLSLAPHAILNHDPSQALQDLADSTFAAKRWQVSPDAIILRQGKKPAYPKASLNLIPSQALPDPADAWFAGERWQISYAPNATILVKSQKSTNLKGESLLAVADPQISEAPKEVEAIAALFPGKNKQVTGPIKEADLKSWAGDYSVLHLSVHGKFEAEPLLSYLVLNKGTPAEWHLTAAAMFGLPLAKARLVVLSACETGEVQATHANELYGMIRALVYAGANTLILSSWRVDSVSTRVWMEAFYKNAQTQPLPEAARQAILAVKNQPQYQHPFYWAPFLMFGK